MGASFGGRGEDVIDRVCRAKDVHMVLNKHQRARGLLVIPIINEDPVVIEYMGAYPEPDPTPRTSLVFRRERANSSFTEIGELQSITLPGVR